MSSKNVLLLYSGGYDSTCLLHDMIQNVDRYTNAVGESISLYPVYCDYGNKNNNAEKRAANEIVELLRSYPSHGRILLHPLQILQLSHLHGSITALGGDCSAKGVFAKEYVPYRNAMLVVSALSAFTKEDRTFSEIYLGCHASDTELKFPDCGEGFVSRMNSLFSMYRSGKHEYPIVVLPFANLGKSDIQKNFGIPKNLYEKVFSGYTDGKPSFGKVPVCPDDEEEEEEEISIRTRNKPKNTAKGAIPPITENDELANRKFDAIMGAGMPAETSLMTKEHEPLIIRKYTQYGFPLYVAMICGADLNNLDELVHSFCYTNTVLLKSNKIQSMRNVVGMLTEFLREHYGTKVEGIAVIWYVDKMMISSLFGDFMTHTSCRIELYSLLQMSCHV